MGRNPDLGENSAEQAIPVGLNNAGGVAPQASSVIGTPAPPPQTIESVGASQAYTCLNPFGPANRLHEGAIVFDLPQLVYGQYLDVDQQFEITDDMSPGSVILQIPYHPISDYTNPFIKQYSSFHTRYNGDLLFRMQMIGNATYSGTLMWFWYPTRYPTSIVSFAEAQKYEYKSMSVVMPSVEAFVHRDARQYQYYREMADGDVANRPHLVLCIHTTVVSPLREGIKVRMRIGSKLASKTDAMIAGVPVQPFCLANPVLQQVNPDNKIRTMDNLTLGQVFPYYSKRQLFGIIDGNSVLPSIKYTDELGRIIDFTYNMMAPGLFGGDFPQTEYKRLFTSASTYTTLPGAVDHCRMVIVLHQLDNIVAKLIAVDEAFTKIPKDPDTWLALFKSAEAIQKHVTVDVIRQQDAPVVLWTDPETPTTVLKIMSQLSMQTRSGNIVALAMQFECKDRDFDAAKKIGVPNSSSGSKLQFPHQPILGPVVHTGQLVTLPTPWFGFKFTELPTTIVTSNDEIAPTCFTDPTILEYFNTITTNTTIDQAFQFDLVDPVSKVRIMTLRYIPQFKNFVINPMDNVKYREYQGDITKLTFANSGNIPLATTMPQSDTSSWPKRFPNTMSSISSTGSSRQWYRSNAALFAAEIGELAEAGSVAGVETTFETALPNEISETEVSGATDEISRPSTQDRYFVSSQGKTWPKDTIQFNNTGTFTNSEGRKWPTQATGRPNLYGTRSFGTQPNQSYTFSRGSQYESVSTSEGTQAGTSAATVRDKVTQVFRPENDQATQVLKPDRDQYTQVWKPTNNQFTQVWKPNQNTAMQTDPVKFADPKSKTVLETAAQVKSYFDLLMGHDKPSDYDRFTYMTSRDSMRVNGNSFVSGEYNRAMQNNQNQWQQQQNDIQRQYQDEQNKQKYAHENDMQSHTFSHDIDMQQGKFNHENEMQRNEFTQQNDMQQRTFQHDTDMSNLGFEHDKTLTGMKISGEIANTATGGAFSIANTMVGKGADMIMQHQNFKNQQSLSTKCDLLLLLN